MLTEPEEHCEIDAIIMYEQQHDDEEILQMLAERGCSPGLRWQILQNAKQTVKREHRQNGLKKAGWGALLLLTGLFFIVNGMDSQVPGRALVVGGALAVAGFYLIATGIIRACRGG